MSEYIRPLLKIIIVFIVAGVIVNDVGSYLVAYYKAHDAADNVVQVFALGVEKGSSTVSGIENAKKKAQSLGVNFTRYEISDERAIIDVEKDVSGTIIISRIEALKNFTKVTASESANLKR